MNIHLAMLGLFCIGIALGLFIMYKGQDNEIAKEIGVGIAVLCCIYATVPFTASLFSITPLSQEKECRKQLEYLHSIGKDVSGMNCSNVATAKAEAKKCNYARETLAKQGNDVSGIQCDDANKQASECLAARATLQKSGVDVSGIKCDAAS